MNEHDRHFPDESRPRYVEPNPDIDRVDMLKRRLYSRTDGLRQRKPVRLKKIESDARNDWGEEPNLNVLDAEPPKRNPFAIIFGIAMVFFLGAAAYAGLVWYGKLPSLSGDDVVLEIVGPGSVEGGDPVAFEVLIANRNQTKMEFVELVLEFPEGTKSEDLSRDMRRETIIIGDIDPGDVVKRDVEVVLYGSEQSVQDITARLSYRLPGSVSVYDREKPFSLTLTKSPLSVVTTIDERVTSGQILDLAIEVSSNSDRRVEGALLRVEYPFGFEPLEEDGVRFGAPGVFDLGTFEPGERKSVRVTGRVTGNDGEEQTFRISSGVRSGPENPTFGATFSTELASVRIERPFLDVAFALAGSDKEVVSVNAERGVRGYFSVTNNLDVEVVNVEVEGRIDGDIVIESDMTPTLGFYRSADNTLIWNQSTSPELKSLLPGDSMRLGFTFSIEDLYNPETQDLVRNPEIFLKLTARGRRVSERNVPEDVVNTVERTVKVNSQVGLSVASTYSTGPFENTGPIPPEIETPTTYTINLSVDNTSNALANGVYEAKLPPYVSWMDTFAPRDESVSYDPVTRVVKWRVGDVPAGAGYSAPSVDLAFQVTLFPSVTQTRDDVDLLSESTFTYYDRFTGQNLIIEHPPVSTKLETDPMYRPGLEVVTDPNAVVR